jgi:hypothetical protein
MHCQTIAKLIFSACRNFKRAGDLSYGAANSLSLAPTRTICTASKLQFAFSSREEKDGKI